MLPTLVEIGPISLHSYGLMLALGFLITLHLARRECAREGLNAEVISDMGFWGLLVGLAGTRILHMIMYREYYHLDDPLGWIAVWRGGLVFQGAILAIPLCYWYLRRHGIPFWKTADIAFTYFPLGHALGRIGCFLNGCCYGKRTDMPWGIPFRRVPWDTAQSVVGSPPFEDHCLRYGLSLNEHWSFPVHPTQLYSALGLVSIFLIMLYLRKKWQPFTGYALPVYFVLYGILRFIVEFFRGDHNPTHFTTLTDQQVFSLLAIVFGIALYFVLRRHAPAKHVQA